MVFCCFGTPVQEPKVAPSQWTSKDVSMWLQSKGLDRHAKAFARVEGKDVLALDEAGLKTLLKAPPSPQLLSAVNALKQQWAFKPLPQAEHAAAAPGALTAAAVPPANSDASSPQVHNSSVDAAAAPEGSAAIVSIAEVQPVVVLAAAGVQQQGELVAGQDGNVVVAAEEEEGEERGMGMFTAVDATQLSTAAASTTTITTAPSAAAANEDVEDQLQHTAGSSVLMHVVTAPAQGVREWTAALHPFTQCETSEAVSEYMEGLGKGMGGGLAEAAVLNPAYGRVFGAAFALGRMSSGAVVNKENCSKAAGLAADTLRILDVAWRRQHSAVAVPQAGNTSVSDITLDQVTSHFNDMRELVVPFTQPGWLLHVCCNERIKDSFDGLHNNVVATLKGEGMELLPSGRPLSRGDYRDVTRVVRRLVRQHGNGSITTGLHNLKEHGAKSEGVKELAALLEVCTDDENKNGTATVMRELAALPTDAAGLDIEVFYARLVTGTAATTDNTVFDWYDKDGKGYIDAAAFHKALQDLGLLDNKSEAEAQAFATASFRAADTGNAGRLGRDAFSAYYATLTTSHARQLLRARMGLAAEGELRGAFHAFASFGSRTEVTEIDNAHFYKLTKDCELVGSNLSNTDVDLIFTKAKSKGARRMTFDQFLTALAMCADKKGLKLEEVVRRIMARGGPVAHATRPDAVRLHDDKSTYTGVYAKGMSVVDAPKNDLSTILDRSEADVRGVKKATPAKATPPPKTVPLSARKPPMGHPINMMSSPLTSDSLRLSMGAGMQTPPPVFTTMTSVPSQRRTSLGDSSVASGGGGGGAHHELNEVFSAFASFGTSAGTPMARSPLGAPAVMGSTARLEMDSSRFQKLCRECRLFDNGKGGFNSTRADLVFAKVKPQGSSKIDYTAFKKAMEMVAAEKKVAAADVISTVCASDGPLLTRSVRV